MWRKMPSMVDAIRSEIHYSQSMMNSVAVTLATNVAHIVVAKSRLNEGERFMVRSAGRNFGEAQKALPMYMDKCKDNLTI